MSDGGRRVVLCRHGRTAWNAAGRFQGQLDSALDELGQRQAAAAAEALIAMAPDVLLCSDAERARRTAASLARLAGLPTTADARLREIDLGKWQGRTREEVEARYSSEYAAWVAGGDLPRGGGETYAEVGARAAAALYDGLAVTPAGGVLVAVTHGGTARAALGVLLELAPASWWRLAPLGNCRWSVLVESPRGWRLSEHNAGDPPQQDLGDDR